MAPADAADEVLGAPEPDTVAAAGAVAEPLRKKPRFSNPSWEVPGIGWIVHDVARNSLDAHCGSLQHVNVKNPCRLNRTLLPGRHPAQGKPVGLLFAWLFANAKRPSQCLHHQMTVKRHQTADDLKELSFDKRVAARKWARDHGLAFLETYESHADKLNPQEPAEFIST